MPLATTARHVLAVFLRQPLVWLWMVSLCVLWPLLAAFAPLGLTTERAGSAVFFYEVAFVSTVLGCSAGLALLQRARWFLAPLSGTRRLGVELVTLATGALLFLSAGLLAPAALGALPARDLAPLLGGASWTLLHTAAVTLVLLRLPLAEATRLVLLPVLVWALPALVSGAALGSIVGHALGVARYLDPDPIEGTVWMGLFGPIVGWGVAASLLSRSTLPSHALRRSR